MDFHDCHRFSKIFSNIKMEVSGGSWERRPPAGIHEEVLQRSNEDLSKIYCTFVRIYGKATENVSKCSHLSVLFYRTLGGESLGILKSINQDLSARSETNFNSFSMIFYDVHKYHWFSQTFCNIFTNTH